MDRIVSTLGSGGTAALLGAFVLTSTVGARAQTSLTLHAAVERALTHNSGLRASAAAVEVAGAQVAEARARLLPRLDFVQSFARTDHPVLAFGARLAQERITSADFAPDALNSPESIHDWMSRLQLQVPLVDVGAWYALHARAYGRDAAQAARRSAEAETIAQTVARYHGLQLAQAQLELTTELLEAARADLERIQRLKAEGTATRADVTALETQVASFRERRIQADGAVAVARARLARVLGSDAEARFELTTPLQEAVLDESGRAALASEHPELARSEAALAQARAQRDRAWAAYAPKLGAMAAAEYHSRDFAGEGGANYLVGVELRINLFAGGAHLARTQQASARVAQAQAQRNDALASLQLQVIQARRSLQDARALIEVTAEAVEHARENHRLERARLEVGMAQTPDVLRSRASLLLAEQRHLEAIYGRRMAAVQLAAATGTLDRRFGGTP